MRILGRILAALLLLVLVAAAVIYVLSAQRAGQTYTSPLTALAVRSDEGTVARGAYLVGIMGCQECHGRDLGGQLLADAPPFRIEPPNLTRGSGGVGARYDDAAWERAVRHAIGQDGRGLYVMPSSAYRNLSDADMSALIAYLKSVPPVEGVHPGVVFKPLGRALVAVGAFEPEVVEEAVQIGEAPPVAATAAYGKYLASFTCMHCHGATLEGGPHPDPAGPPVPSLRAWAHRSPAEFARAVRQGIAGDGRSLDPAFMPWSAFATMTDLDVAALHGFVRSLEGLPPDTSAVVASTRRAGEQGM